MSNSKSLSALMIIGAAVNFSLPALAQNNVNRVSTNGWVASDLWDDNNPGCVVGVDGSEPGSRMTMGVSRNRPNPASLVFRRPDWSIRAGLPITIQANFDGRTMLIEGVGSGNAITVDLSGETMRTWFHNITAASGLRVAFLGGTSAAWTIDLHGSSAVVNAMGDCVHDRQLVGVGLPFSSAPTQQPSGEAAPTQQTSSLQSAAPPPAIAAQPPRPMEQPSSAAGTGSFPVSREPVIAAWSGAAAMQTRPFHVDGPWELQWINQQGFFAITLNTMGSDKQKLITNDTKAGSSSYYFPTGGDFFFEFSSSTSWQARVVSVATTNTPAAVVSTLAPAASIDVPPPPAVVPATIPAQGEAAFVSAVDGARRRYNDAPTEFAKGAMRPTRAQAVCQALRSNAVEGWTGTIDTLSTNGDGKGVVSVEIAPDLHLKTWNNSLSDLSDNTLIAPTSSVYRAISALRVGQKVRFSGHLFTDQADCVKETSLTMQGSMTDPEYLFRFESFDRD